MCFLMQGIFNGNCGMKPTHAMAVVGYGSENGQDYWLLKNSWGFNWGEKGYAKMVRNVNEVFGKCGIVYEAIYPM